MELRGAHAPVAGQAAALVEKAQVSRHTKRDGAATPGAGRAGPEHLAGRRAPCVAAAGGRGRCARAAPGEL